ncbi:type 1 periplasmic binding fold superfamily protein [Arcticibacterium luteifluviistationis]|uniref:Type 1 periplasmic binding fold superfamily protein n=1 Tax=Arcticibacterium luteifluviistationis TaxID=1784714 RepID=A0A2Z4G784_9BACT|nr:type 1 periplasmic binding fold superfamily protein [Arcticibacterium luteifluviistationis]AWV96940.1 type 1 periplasmic binding fold superfamily protein [Arcticibacterium luteifluviistationis]
MSLKVISGFLFLALLNFSCEKDDPVIPNEEELITTLNYQLVPEGGGDTVVLSFKDIDGDGGNAPVITNGVLKANTTYVGTLSLLNESVSPVESITEEVEEEGDEHQFFFEKSDALDVAISYDDVDANGDPVGLKTRLVTGAVSNGTLVITLRHEPSKAASGVSDGLIANAGGETDIEVSFNVEVE